MARYETGDCFRESHGISRTPQVEQIDDDLFPLQFNEDRKRKPIMATLYTNKGEALPIQPVTPRGLSQMLEAGMKLANLDEENITEISPSESNIPMKSLPGRNPRRAA